MNRIPARLFNLISTRPINCLRNGSAKAVLISRA